MKYIFYLVTFFASLIFPYQELFSQVVTIYNNDSTLLGTGMLQQGKMEGLWKFMDPSNKSLIQEGHYIGGQKNGRWTSYYPNGKPLIKAEYKNNSLNGLYREYDSKGTLVLETAMKDSVLIGLFKMYYGAHETPDDRKTQLKTKGEFKDGEISGSLISYYPNGQVSSRQNFVDGILDGAYQMYDDSGELILETNYKNNSPHGPYIRMAGGMVVEEGEHDIGRRVGKWKKYFPLTRVMESETYYDNQGNRSGEWTYFYENRRVARVERYENDIPTGTWEEFYPNRNLAKRKTYELGMPSENTSKTTVMANLQSSANMRKGLEQVCGKTFFLTENCTALVNIRMT